ncbi:DUF4823 domain-containing protein [Pseudomonas gregormendelii]|uniref:DUF4823 domain-containing protein n=1 Tax=Pseudomonas gregormendelii TaxID=1628277 RepID=A0ABS3AJD8_9PSED|nr:DUF4823 domain-containing protein [Pseudomonas gregormendelii]MBN3967023.1 DUF4823 domain-containing protein [Pseudomonas gregormendelii]
MVARVTRRTAIDYQNDIMLNLHFTDARKLNVTLLIPLYLIPPFLMLTGCISIPDAESTKATGTSNIAANHSPICIKTPGDPSFQQHVYVGAGKLIAEKVRSGVEKSGRTSFVIDDPAKAQVAGCQFMLDSQIIEYEDRATGWSGIPDRISLRVSLYPITDPEAQRSFMYIAKSSAMGSAFLEWGNANPASLLQQQFADDVVALISK